MREARSNYKRPANMEFSQEVKVRALNNAGWRCSECGIRKKDTQEGFLEAHHILSLYSVVNYFPYLSADAVSSIVNCEILCCSCHHKRHENWVIQDDYQQVEVLEEYSRQLKSAQNHIMAHRRSRL